MQDPFSGTQPCHTLLLEIAVTDSHPNNPYGGTLQNPYTVPSYQLIPVHMATHDSLGLYIWIQESEQMIFEE
jgi:hypothetical protein